MFKSNGGFTLVELIVVIAILAILATVSVVGYTSFIESADKVPAEAGAEAAAGGMMPLSHTVGSTVIQNQNHSSWEFCPDQLENALSKIFFP